MELARRVEAGHNRAVVIDPDDGSIGRQDPRAPVSWGD
jgi:hypothetical protein